MAQISSGWTYEPSGVKSEVTAENLNAHVNNAQLLAGSIDEQDTNSLTADTDTILITKGGSLFKQTKGQFTHTINANTVNATNINGGAMVPIGGIIMWSGAENALPVNWKICDGTNNTPDLRGKFIRGSDPTANPPIPTGTLGGANEYVLTGVNIPEHQHQFRIRQLDYVEIFGSSTLTVWDVYPQWDENPVYNTQTRLTGPASVGGSTNPTPIPTIPAFYALAYIMRVS
jgi:hypothetical protein